MQKMLHDPGGSICNFRPMNIRVWNGKRDTPRSGHPNAPGGEPDFGGDIFQRTHHHHILYIHTIHTTTGEKNKKTQPKKNRLGAQQKNPQAATEKNNSLQFDVGGTSSCVTGTCETSSGDPVVFGPCNGSGLAAFSFDSESLDEAAGFAAGGVGSDRRPGSIKSHGSHDQGHPVTVTLEPKHKIQNCQLEPKKERGESELG